MEKSNPLDLLGNRKLPLLVAGGAFLARFFILLALPPESLRGYGDFLNYYFPAELPGWPYLHYWSEYPPVFPFLSSVLYRITGGQEHIYTYLLAFLLILADAGSAALFTRLVMRVYTFEQVVLRSVAYLLVLISLPYGWWYLDPLVVFLMLLGLNWILDGKALRGAAVLGLGVATKFFPGLALLAAWRRYSWKKLAGLAVLAVAPILVLYLVLWLASPAFTVASIHSQASKGSWESAWALLDGNLRTGNFGAVIERLDPSTAVQTRGAPARIPPALSILVFAGVGLFGLLRVRPPLGQMEPLPRQSLGLVGFAWGLFALWSPGWSPQWVLYLLPLILLALPGRQAVLLVVTLILVNLLEWPVLLSRGYFTGLWITIPLRTVLLGVMTLAFYQTMTCTRNTASA